jgi:hypothetical protein
MSANLATTSTHSDNENQICQEDVFGNRFTALRKERSQINSFKTTAEGIERQIPEVGNECGKRAK